MAVGGVPRMFLESCTSKQRWFSQFCLDVEHHAGGLENAMP